MPGIAEPLYIGTHAVVSAAAANGIMISTFFITASSENHSRRDGPES
jgi:hypothetical protein